MVASSITAKLSEFDTRRSVQADLARRLISRAYKRLLECLIGCRRIHPVVTAGSANAQRELRTIILIDEETAGELIGTDEIVFVIVDCVEELAAEKSLAGQVVSPS